MKTNKFVTTQIKLRRWFILTTFFSIFLFLVACSSGTSPLIVRAEIFPEPVVGQEVTLHIEMLAKGRDLPNTLLTVELSEGIELIAGKTTWEGDLPQDQSIPFDLTIKVREAGEWSIYSHAYSDLGNSNGFGGSKNLYITSTFDTAKVEEDTDRPRTAPPIMQTDDRFAITSPSDTPTPGPASPISKSPLFVTAEIFPEPLIGQVATLHIEFVSQDDEPLTTLEIFLPEGIKLVKGDLTWKGSLTANQTQTHEISICTLYEGLWWIKMRARPWEAENDFKYTEEAGLILEVTQTNADVTTTENFYYTQPPDTPGPRILSTALPVDWVSPCP